MFELANAWRARNGLPLIEVTTAEQVAEAAKDPDTEPAFTTVGDRGDDSIVDADSESKENGESSKQGASDGDSDPDDGSSDEDEPVASEGINLNIRPDEKDGMTTSVSSELAPPVEGDDDDDSLFSYDQWTSAGFARTVLLTIGCVLLVEQGEPGLESVERRQVAGCGAVCGPDGVRCDDAARPEIRVRQARCVRYRSCSPAAWYLYCI